MLRRRVLRHRPAVGPAVFILQADKIRNAQIRLHLQPRDARFKARVAAFAVIELLFEEF